MIWFENKVEKWIETNTDNEFFEARLVKYIIMDNLRP